MPRRNPVQPLAETDINCRRYPTYTCRSIRPGLPRLEWRRLSQFALQSRGPRCMPLVGHRKSS
ncbi:hypothetical protein RB6782 [Rhodopirellula baltica SH 1]|uniref:Uncharacterized protein n=1 Tax=Rhodopirellula baltica (strain DSM 10527 / NCIMB 13988 / SH1) TaxID=243090 RepID=Q7UPQ7_RHOBA|nr:hypothetical protein RB6782 [Rhodopirellula baltica SH 1]